MNLAIFGVMGGQVLAHALRHQMTPIAGGIDQQIVTCGSHRPIEGHLQALVAGLPLLKGQVITEHDEALGAIRHQIDDVGQIGQIGFVDLDQAQAPGGIRIQAGLDQRGFACSPGPCQQDIVGGQALHELTGVAFDQRPGFVDMVQVIQGDVRTVMHRLQHRLTAQTCRATTPAPGHRSRPVDLDGPGQQCIQALKQMKETGIERCHER